jgi:FkbM family methyltransferase
LDINDPISRSLFVHGEYELDLVSDAMSLIRNLRNLPRGKGAVLDIGANNGVISIGMLVAGEVEKAIAIEPEPRNFSILKHNVKQNHLESVITCLNFAASDRKSTLQFELSESNYGDHRVHKSLSATRSKELYNESKRHVIAVEANTLDNLLADLDTRLCQDISVVWIDVQGYEGYVFSGSKKLLSSSIPVVSEIWPYGIQRAGMSQEEFCGIVREIWSVYWVRQRGRFVKYPMDVFSSYFDELGYDGDFDNVIFTR